MTGAPRDSRRDFRVTRSTIRHGVATASPRRREADASGHRERIVMHARNRSRALRVDATASTLADLRKKRAR